MLNESDKSGNDLEQLRYHVAKISQSYAKLANTLQGCINIVKSMQEVDRAYINSTHKIPIKYYESISKIKVNIIK